MKKQIVLVGALLLLIVCILPVRGEITSTAWLGSTFTGRDDYYNANVNAYAEEASAVLAVTVRNNLGTTINVTSVHVNFDWKANYSSTQVGTDNPETMQHDEVRVFFINFQIPNVTTASNLYVHSYSIVAEYLYPNATDPQMKLKGSFDIMGNAFAVYSNDQAAAVDTRRVIEGFMPFTSFSSATGKILIIKATNETNAADRYYSEGNFPLAKQHYDTALSLINQAYTAEQGFMTVYEDLSIQQLQASINQLNGMANFFSGLSAMWILFGIGGVLFGLGYIIKWLLHGRQPKTANP